MKPGRKPDKKRLDVQLVERALVESRQNAQGVILAGQVRVNGQKVDKCGAPVAENATIEIVGQAQRYASRAGVKLEGALADFGISAAGKVCLDVGSSTGGFTDCLLQHGAHRVFAVDVTVGQLAGKLRSDSRVVPVERNARYLKFADLGEPVDLVTVDLSFISVAKVLPALVPLAKAGADFLILIKPQFELERRNVGKGGIVRDSRLQERAIQRVEAAARQVGLPPVKTLPSRLPGAEGNLEFFLHARREALG